MRGLHPEPRRLLWSRQGLGGVGATAEFTGQVLVQGPGATLWDLRGSVSSCLTQKATGAPSEPAGTEPPSRQPPSRPVRPSQRKAPEHSFPGVFSSNTKSRGTAGSQAHAWVVQLPPRGPLRPPTLTLTYFWFSAWGCLCLRWLCCRPVGVLAWASVCCFQWGLPLSRCLPPRAECTVRALGRRVAGGEVERRSGTLGDGAGFANAGLGPREGEQPGRSQSREEAWECESQTAGRADCREPGRPARWGESGSDLAG